VQKQVKSRLFSYLKRKGYKKILLVIGNKSKKQKKIKNYISLLNNLFTIEVYFKKAVNPEFDEAFLASRKISKFKNDAIIAIGGGSVIDTAKLIAAFEKYSKKDAKNIAIGKKLIDKKIAPIIALPTTLGTGSEVTHFSVVYVKKKKYSLASSKLKPLYYYLDPELTYSLSPYTIASSGFDALSQAIESAWSIKSNYISRKYSYKAIKIITKNIKKTLDSRDKYIRKKMLEAANLAGKAINITKTTAPHALSYEIATMSNIAHGHSVALTLGYFFEINYFSNSTSLGLTKNKLKKRMNEIFRCLGVNNAAHAKNEWYKLMKECKLETDINKLKLNSTKNINRIVSSVNTERLKNHPVILTKDDYKKIFE